MTVVCLLSLVVNLWTLSALVRVENERYHTNDGSNFDGVVNAAGVVGDETRPRNVALVYAIRFYRSGSIQE